MMGKKNLKRIVFFFFLAGASLWANCGFAGCDNCEEITSDDVAWEHMDDADNEGQCECRYGQFSRTGTLVTVWEPVRIIETVKDPYCIMADGDMMDIDDPLTNGDGSDDAGGTHSDTGSQEDHSVFQQAHILLPDYIQQSIQEIDNRCWHSSVGNTIDYFSEDDSAWNDDSIAETTYPLTSLAADYDMQMACEDDAIYSQIRHTSSLAFLVYGSMGIDVSHIRSRKQRRIHNGQYFRRCASDLYRRKNRADIRRSHLLLLCRTHALMDQKLF